MSQGRRGAGGDEVEEVLSLTDGGVGAVAGPGRGAGHWSQVRHSWAPDTDSLNSSGIVDKNT